MADLLVLGGGPAGLAAAIHGAKIGMKVKLLERAAGPIDKACGEGLMPPALRSLRNMGIGPLPGHPFVGIRYLDEQRSIEARFDAGPGLGLRRTTLHAALHERALTLGVEHHRGSLERWSQDQTGVEVNGLRGSWLIAADGLHSPMRRALGLELPPRRQARVGLRRHFSVAPWSDHVEVYWSAQAEAYVTPVTASSVGVAILTYADRLPTGTGPAFDRLLALFPNLASRLTKPCSEPRGAGPFEQRLRARRAGRVLLVGDAAGYLDALTGEGIRLGFDTAEAAIDCLRRDQPGAYDRAWWRCARRYWWLTAGLLSLSRRASLRPSLLRLLEAQPWLFRSSVNMLAR